MVKNKAHRIAFFGVMAALLFVVFLIETLIGSVWITPPAIFSLSILFTLCLSDDYLTGLIGGILFGVMSFIIAVIVANPLFILPWISILPRCFVGIGSYGTYRGLKALFKKGPKFSSEVLPYSLGAAVGIITNTLLVVLCLTFFSPEAYGQSFAEWMKAVLTINFPIELGAAIILTPIFSKVFNKVTRKSEIDTSIESSEEKKKPLKMAILITGVLVLIAVAAIICLILLYNK